LGAEIIWAGDKQRDLVLRQTYENSLREGKKPYLIPYGGSNVLGACAYAFAMQEMLDQNEDVDWVVFASSSGGTQAGLVVGAQMFGYQGSLLGISIDEQAGELKKRVATLAGETAQFLGIDGSFSGDQVLVNDDYLGDGYGIMGEAEVEALQLFSRYEGLFLDPVYTGRAAAGMIDLIRKGFFSAEERVLFWHTGGTPALFANPYVSQLSYGLDG
jgi:1-aminocyclopropane-1-carboxylate deaminase/D-cysteine desulfhydrase-like pyridoxal-dependent ACC family enzyme